MIHMVSIKLTSTNYLLWKRQVIPMLTGFHLLGFVNGTEAAPSPTILSPTGESTTNPAYTKWLDTDQRLLSVLFSTLSEEAMSEVVDCISSRAAWTTLEAAFPHSSVSRVHQLREELLSLRRGSLSVKEYGTRFKTLCDQLSAIGKPVDDLDKSLVSSWPWPTICELRRCSNVHAVRSPLLHLAPSSYIV